MGIRFTSNQAFWKAFCRKSLSQLLSICRQSSSKILLWVSYREMWSLFSCYCNTAPTRTFWAFSVLDMHSEIAKKKSTNQLKEENQISRLRLIFALNILGTRDLQHTRLLKRGRKGRTLLLHQKMFILAETQVTG